MFDLQNFLKPYIGKIVVSDSVYVKTEERQNKLYNGNITNQIVRQVLPNELILEFDHLIDDRASGREESDFWINKIEEILKATNTFYRKTDHGGKSPHIRVYFDGIDNIAPEKRKLYFSIFVSELLKDINFYSTKVKIDDGFWKKDFVFVPMEERPHWKPEYNGAIEEIVYENKGNNMRYKEENLITITPTADNSLIGKTLELCGIEFKKMICCPFHEDNNPSMSIYNGKAHCFVCNKTWNPIEFIVNAKKVTFNEARKMLGIKEEIVRNNIIDEIRTLTNRLEISMMFDKKWLFKVVIFNKENKQVISEEFPDKFWMKEYVRNRFIKLLDTYKLVSTKDFEEWLSLFSLKVEKEKEILQQPMQESEIIHHLKEAENLIKFHPAQFFEIKNDKVVFASYGIRVPVKRATEIIDTSFIVNSNRSIFELTRSELDKRDYYQPDPIDVEMCHWSFKDIQNYIGGDISSDVKTLPLKIYNEIKNFIYLEKKEDYMFFTCWFLGTYVHQLFNTYPYVFLHGHKECGKTKTLSLAHNICFNSIHAGSSTSSQLFRPMKANRCTFLIDEGEKLADPKRAEEMRSLLLNGYKKSAVVRRTASSEENFKSQEFELYGPKMIANINGMDDVLESRCITIIMIRNLPDDLRGKKKILDYDAKWKILRDLAYRWGLEHCDEVYQNYLNLDSETNLLNNRNWELWQPILSMAKVIQTQSGDTELGNIYDILNGYANKRSNERLLDSSELYENMFLAALYVLPKADYYVMKGIVEHVRLNIGGDCPEFVNQKWVGKQLKRYGFSTKKKTKLGIEYFIDPARAKQLISAYNPEYLSNSDDKGEQEIRVGDSSPSSSQRNSDDKGEQVNKVNLPKGSDKLFEGSQPHTALLVGNGGEDDKKIYVSQKPKIKFTSSPITDDQSPVNYAKNETSPKFTSSPSSPNLQEIISVLGYRKVDTILIPCKKCEAKEGCSYTNMKGEPVCALCVQEEVRMVKNDVQKQM